MDILSQISATIKFNVDRSLIESLKSSSNAINRWANIIFLLASVRKKRRVEEKKKKKTMIRRSSWRTRAGSRKNAIILLRKCVRVPPLFWRHTHASENDCVTTRNSCQVSRNEQPAANVIIIVGFLGHDRVMKKEEKKERKNRDRNLLACRTCWLAILATRLIKSIFIREQYYKKQRERERDCPRVGRR